MNQENKLYLTPLENILYRTPSTKPVYVPTQDL
jgi:hypothetical protein